MFLKPGAIVSTGAVVTRDVADYAVVAGNPARTVRMRFDDDEVRTLLELAWWDWPRDAITEHVRVIADGSVAELRRAAASVEPAVGSEN